MFRKKSMSTALAFASATLLVSQSHAAATIEEVIVTAQKRTESAQSTPISISAFSEDFIKESNIVNAADLVGFTPGLNGSSERDTASSITVRGIGTYAFSVGVDNSVGMYIDDVPVSRFTLIGNSFFDLERIEVVKGPQGTLFGRNSSAGAISLITKKPNLEENSLEVTVGAGNESQLLYQLYGNLAVSDKLALRASIRHDERDGFWENVPTGDQLNNRDHTNARFALRYAATDNLMVDLSLEDVRIDTRSGTSRLTEVYDDKLYQNELPTQDIQSKRYLAKVTWDISDSMTLTSNTSYLDYDMLVTPLDVDMTETLVLNLFEPEEGTQFMQELRLNGSSGSFDWFVGASYIKEELENHTTYQWDDFELLEVLGGPGLGTDVCSQITCNAFNEQAHDAATDNTSYAVYTDVAWSINDSWKLTVGARYTQDEKDFLVNQEIGDSATSQVLGDAVIFLGTDGPVTADETWSSFDPRVVLDYKVTDDVLLYTSVASGYKSGGFNSDVANSLASGIPQELVPFDEERVLAYEAGVKSQFLDGRAQVNASVYYNDYEDFQLETSSLAGIFISNAGTVESKGFEIDGTFLLGEKITLMANYSYLDATFTDTVIGTSDGDVDVSGNPLQRAPENSGGVVLVYSTPIGDLGELSLRGDYQYTDDVVFDVVDQSLKQDGYGLFNARIGFRANSDKWEVALIGSNLGDEEYTMHQTAPLGEVLAVPGMRRLYRVEATMRF